MQSNFLFTSVRLGFRAFQETDFEDLLKLDTDPEVRNFFPTGVATAEKIKEKIQKNIVSYATKGFSDFIVTELATGEFVGRAGMGELPNGEIEIGYVLLKKFWGKGFATEALQTLLAWAKKNISKDKIVALAPVDHVASHHVMEKAGMMYFKTDIAYGVDCKFYKKDLD